MEENNNPIQGQTTNLGGYGTIPQPQFVENTTATITPNTIHQVAYPSQTEGVTTSTTGTNTAPQPPVMGGIPQVAQQQANNEAAAQVVHQSQTVVDTNINQTIPQVQPVMQPSNMQPEPQPIPNNVEPTPEPIQPVMQPENVQTQEVEQPVKQQEPQKVVEENKPVEPIVTDKYMIRTLELSSMINNALKLAIGIDGLTLTTIIQLVFTNEGLVMKSTDNDNVLTQINRNIKYEDELSISVSASLFSELISKLKSEYIEIKPDLETRTINIHSGRNTFKLAEYYDNDSGESIDIADNYVGKGNSNIKVDIEEFKTRINEANTFMGSENVYSFLAGVYCSDRIYSTDKENMFAIPNLPQLVNENFYLTKKFAAALAGIKYDGEATISLIKNESGDCTALSISTNDITLSGPTHPEKNEYPVEAVKGLIDKTFDNESVIDADELLTFAQIGKIFLQPGSDKDMFEINVISDTKTMNIKNRSTATDMNIELLTNNVPDKNFWLHIPSIIRALNNIDRTNVKIVFGNYGVQGESFVKLESGDVVELLSMKEPNF